MNFNDTYTANYGTNAKVLLRILGGDPDQIISKYEANCSAVPDSIKSMFHGAGTPKAFYAHEAILREIKRIYFSKISRDAAVVIANSLGDLGSISICTTIPELTFNNWAYANEWNKANCNQQPIRNK